MRRTKVIYTYEICFINPDTGDDDVTQVCASTKAEALRWFRKDFCKDNDWSEKTKVQCCFVVYNKDDEKYYETEEPEYVYRY